MIDYIQHILEIEEIKKEHDKLMINKVTKYENEIAELKKRIKELENSLSIALEINDKYQRENKELKEDNKKLAEQVSDKANLVKKLRDKGLL
jgi:regulator of replication initiation timing